MTLKMNTPIFWNMTSCTLLEVDRRFGER